MTYEEKVKAGLVDNSGDPDTAWFVVDGQVEKVTGKGKIQVYLRENPNYPTQMHGTKAAAEDWLQSTHHPVEYAVAKYKRGEITELDLRQSVGEIEAAKVLRG